MHDHHNVHSIDGPPGMYGNPVTPEINMTPMSASWFPQTVPKWPNGRVSGLYCKYNLICLAQLGKGSCTGRDWMNMLSKISFSVRPKSSITIPSKFRISVQRYLTSFNVSTKFMLYNQPTIGTMTAFLTYLKHQSRTALFMIIIHHEVINWLCSLIHWLTRPTGVTRTSEWSESLVLWKKNTPFSLQ